MLRFDTVHIGAADRATRTDEGWILDTPPITRSGVFPYRRPDGTLRREWRPPEWVHHPKHLADLRGIPITVDHPPTLVSDTSPPKPVGAVLSAGTSRGDAVHAEVVIYDPNALGARRGLSLGYRITRLDVASGRTPEGEEYDAIQVGPYTRNHMSVVLLGRAGADFRLRLDAEDAMLDDPADLAPDDLPAAPPAAPAPPVNNRQEGQRMAETPLPLVPIRLDGVTVGVSPDVATAIEKMRIDAAAAADKLRTDAEAQAAKAREEIAAARSRADALEAERDALKAEAAKHPAVVAQARTDAVAEVKARLVLESEASKHGVEVRADMSDRAVREAVVNKLAPDIYRFDGKSDEYLAYAYDHALADAAKRSANAAAQAAQATPSAAAATSATTPTVRADAASIPVVARSAADVARAMAAAGHA